MDPSRKPPLLCNELRFDRECRRRRAESLYVVEIEMRRNGMVDRRLLYDEERDLYRFSYDGVFAFSREHANWAELERRGMLDG